MDFLSYEKRLEYLLELIEKSRLRSLSQVAKSFSCSTRTVKRMIAHLRETGHDIPRGGKVRNELLHYAVVFWHIPGKKYGLALSCAFYPFR